MKTFITTDRLILREIVPEDEDSFFAMDSDPDVHVYLGKNPVQSKSQITEVIRFIRQQYEENGIGRWAAVEKASGEFIGWTGLKLVKDTINGHSNYYDLGYRFAKKYWGKGYATETAQASVHYAFTEMKLDELFGMADVQNLASNRVLLKAGLKPAGTCAYDNRPTNWLRLTRQEWEENQKKGNDHS